MSAAVWLAIHEFVEINPTGVRVIVRSHAGELWRGTSVNLTDDDERVIAGPLTVEVMHRYAEVPVDLVDPIHVAMLTLTGPAGRAAAAATKVVGIPAP